MNIRLDIQSRLMLLYREHAKRKPEPESQMCCLWSIDDPPDVLLCTEPLEAIEEEFDIVLTDNEAVELYDMRLAEAAGFIERVIGQQLMEDDE